MDPNKLHERVLEIQKNIETASAENQTAINQLSYLMVLVVYFVNGKQKEHIVDSFMVMVYHLEYGLKVN